MSSLGLLSDLSGLIDEGEDLTKLKSNIHHKRPHTSEPLKVDVSLQTNLKFTTINEIFKHYNELINAAEKEVSDVSVQVDSIDDDQRKVNSCTQTEVKKFVEKSISVQKDLKVPSVTQSTSCDGLVATRNSTTQCEKEQKKSVQVQVTESQLSKNVQGRRAHFDQNKFFSPCREMLDKTTNEGDVTAFKEISTSGHERIQKGISNGLYTYKLSGDKRVSPKSRIPTSINNQQALNCSNFQLTPSSSTGSKSCPNTPSSPPASSPFHVHDQVPSPNAVHFDGMGQQLGKSKSCRECRSLQPEPDINHRHYSTSSSSSTSSLNDIVTNKTRRTTTTVPLLSPLQEVSLTEDQRLFNTNQCRRYQRPKTSPNLEVKTTLGCNNNPLIADCCCKTGQKCPSVNSLSSPDLGIGDSDDHQESSNLKACLSLPNYQRLRGLINESICIMNTLEGIQRDFSLSILSRTEFVAESSPHLSALTVILSSAKNIFKSIYINEDCGKDPIIVPTKVQMVSLGTMTNDGDDQKLRAELESLKRKKQKMERAISRQLQKTDQLLRKAAAINDLTE